MTIRTSALPWFGRKTEATTRFIEQFPRHIDPLLYDNEPASVCRRIVADDDAGDIDRIRAEIEASANGA